MQTAREMMKPTETEPFQVELNKSGIDIPIYWFDALTDLKITGKGLTSATLWIGSCLKLSETFAVDAPVTTLDFARDFKKRSISRPFFLNTAFFELQGPLICFWEPKDISVVLAGTKITFPMKFYRRMNDFYSSDAFVLH
jgi:hypothetical protein